MAENKIAHSVNKPLYMVGVGKLEGGAVQGLLLAAGATVAFSLGAVLFRGRYSNMPLLPVNFWMSVCAMFCFAPSAMQSSVTPLAVSIPALLALGWLAVVSLLGMVRRQALTEEISPLTKPLAETLAAAWERVCSLASQPGRQGDIKHL